MTERSKPNLPDARGAGLPSSTGEVEAFLAATRQAPSAATRLIFALDATLSRQPSWAMAGEVQGAMFEAAASLGGLSVQLAYFRGLDECQASRWVGDPLALRRLMQRIECRGGHTQIARILDHARTQARAGGVGALIYVGDAVEESVDHLCAIAGEVGLLGTRAFLFQEGRDPVAEQAFREIARLTGGAYLPFDPAAPGLLAGLLRAIVAFAGGGEAALRRLAATDGDARRLIAAMGAPR